jgi:hypothetical protein
LLQPFLGAICSILIVSDIRLEIIYLVMGSSKLMVSISKPLVKLLPAMIPNDEASGGLLDRPGRRKAAYLMQKR